MKKIFFAVLVLVTVLMFIGCGYHSGNGLESNNLPQGTKLIEFGKFPPEGPGLRGVRICVIERDTKQFIIVYDGDCIAITQIK